MTAEKLISQLIIWKTKPPSLAGALPELYQRWLYKRALLHRPLCRRYWPLTSPSDTNPHNVFRSVTNSDLKRSHRCGSGRERRNVIASESTERTTCTPLGQRWFHHHSSSVFVRRKLQSLRRELGKARIILQLVVERELMKQVAIKIPCPSHHLSSLGSAGS